MTDKNFDVIVIGGGPAGYPAAIRAAQNKLKVACIDEWKNEDGTRLFGGTCLNAGCIPSKALLESSELYHRAQHEFAAHGIKVGGLGIDLAAMQNAQARHREAAHAGHRGAVQGRRRHGLQGHGKLLAGNASSSRRTTATKTLAAKHVVLATGSAPIELPIAQFDGKHIVDSLGRARVRRRAEAPRRHRRRRHRPRARQRLAAARLRGRRARSARHVPADGRPADREGSAAAFQEAGARHPARREGHRRGRRKATRVKVRYETGGAAQELVRSTSSSSPSAAGRSRRTCFAPTARCPLDERGFIKVDEKCRTTVPNVWAVGDVVRGPMLAHKGKEEGVMVAELIAGHVAEVNYKTIPSVIYTAPEIAWVGQTEEEVKESGRPYKVGTFPFAASGRAKGMKQAAGFVKLIADQEHDDVLGVHIIGPVAGELIAEAVLAMEYSASTEDLQRTIHAHPTLTEALHEAALAADKRAIHGINR